MKQKLLLLLVIISIFSCGKDKTDEKLNLIMSKTQLTLQLTTTEQLSIIGPDKYVGNSNLIWVSVNPKIVQVDQTGKIIALTPGKTEVYAYVKGLNAVRGECQVTITDKLNAELKITAPNKSIDAGQKLLIQYAYTPTIIDGSSDIEIIQSDSVGPKIIEVSLTENKFELLLTALSPGKVRVILKNTFDASVKDSVEITVAQVAMTSFKFTIPTFDLQEGASDSLRVEILPKEAAYRKIQWRSADPSTISVDAKGQITALKTVGSAKVYASTDDGVVISCLVNITARTMEKIKIEQDTININITSLADIITPLKISTTPINTSNYTLRTDASFVPKNEQKADISIKNGAIVVNHATTQTGSDRIIAEIINKEGKKVSDTCIVNIMDVADDIVTCKPTYSTIDFGKNCKFHINRCNFD